MSDSRPGSERSVIRTNLLDTRTTNFAELVGNGRVYRVPPYQRDYWWTGEQWEDLWHDIRDLRGDRAQRHYMGALVVEGKTDRECFRYYARQIESDPTLTQGAPLAELLAETVGRQLRFILVTVEDVLNAR